MNPGTVMPDVAEAVRALITLDWDFKDADTGYLTHSLHPYPAKFIPQIPRYLIRALSKPGDTVADIFCGSGTTLVEALLLGRNAVGVDASELACLISKVKTMAVNDKDLKALKEFTTEIEILLHNSETSSQQMLFRNDGLESSHKRPEEKSVHFWFKPEVIEEYSAIRSLFLKLPDRPRFVVQTCFSSILVAVSKQDSDTRYVRREKQIRPGDTFRRFLRALRDAITALKSFSDVVDGERSCRIIHADVLSGPDIGTVNTSC